MHLHRLRAMVVVRVSIASELLRVSERRWLGLLLALLVVMVLVLAVVVVLPGSKW